MDEYLLGSIGVERPAKGIALEGAARKGHTGAPELLVVGVPCLNETTFGLYAVIGFKGIQALELALILLWLLPESEAATQEHKAKRKKKLSHGGGGDYYGLVYKGQCCF